MQQEIRIVRYNDSLINEWNAIISNSKNGTFLLNRNFMDYHKERFNDCSLMFVNEKDKFIACLPANYDTESRTVYSHQGLTYGGFNDPKSHNRLLSSAWSATTNLQTYTFYI